MAGDIGGAPDGDQPPVELVDYDPEEDQLMVLWSPGSEPEPEITVEQDPDAPDEQVIRVNGTEALRVSGAAPLSASDIQLVDVNDPTFADLLPS